MNKPENINTFFNALRQSAGAIWIEEEKIKFSAPKEFQNQETKDFIQQHKNKITAVLQDNDISSAKKFLSVTILKDSTQSYYPLSPGQESLWFIEQYEEGTSAYHLPSVYELDVNTDKEGIKYALQQIVSRHEVLRSTIEQVDTLGHSIQKVQQEPLLIEEFHLRENDDYTSLIKAEINRPFNLSAEYPVRAKFYVLQPGKTASGTASDKTLLLINMHHIVNDGWSNDLFEKELFIFYEAYINKQTDFSLPPLSIQYKDYAVWQKSYLNGKILTKQLSYWKEKLTGYQALQLPTDYPRPATVDYRGARGEFTLNKAISGKLRALVQQYGVTLNSVMLSSLNVLLGKYTGQQDIVTGSPNANRHHRQTEELIGFFINMQVNRTQLNTSQGFGDLIQQVHQEQIAARFHHDLPFEMLMNELGVERDASRHPVFQVIFEVLGFGNQKNNPTQQKQYLRPYEIEAVHDVERFDLSVFIDDSQEEIAGKITYATSLFHKNTIVRLINHYINLLDQLTETPEKPYSQMSLLWVKEEGQMNCTDDAKNKTPYCISIAEERQQVLGDFNHIPSNYEGGYISVISLFAKQVQNNPDATALYYEGIAVSYRDLDEQSNKLAYYLQTSHQLQTNELVGILLDRSDKMLLAIWAVLKAGGAYVPIDPAYPSARKSYIINDAGIALLLTQTDYMFELDYYQGAVFALDVQLDDLEVKAVPLTGNKPSDLAYVIYTSGSTGQPKGCLIRHSNLSHYIQWANNYYFNSGAQGNFGLYTSLSFDLTVTSIFCALSRGKCLTIYPQYTELADILRQSFSNESGIDSIKLTPSHIKLLEQLNINSSTMACAIVGGEAVNTDHVRILKKINPGIRIFNEYGPTETTVGCVVQELQPDQPVLIGKPIYGVRIYILGPCMELLPIGVPGEICIAGLGVGPGYLNKPALTDEKFVPNPFEADQLMYRTGDIGRWLNSGELDYQGRKDDQVKIRGYRIELGEIENALLQVTGIKQTCVLARERKTDAGKTVYLAAYYVLNQQEETLSQTIILDQLKQLLPEYMLPAVLMQLETFPLTVNGKLDKRALPDPDFNSSVQEHVEASTETEKELCMIWQEILGGERIGITDDFFKAGGNSIIAIQVSHRMSKALNCDIKVADVFKYKNIRALLAHNLDKTQVNISSVIADQAVLSFAQERLWFIEQYEDGSNAYHIPFVFELDVDTGVEGIKYALQQVVSRHEVLRSTIKQGDNQQGIQLVHQEPLTIEEKIISAEEDYNSLIKADINRPFDLSREYPVRVKLYFIQSEKVASIAQENKILMLINTHHIASDGWSYNIFQKELFAYYEAYCKNDAKFSLPALEIQYKDYAVWQRSYLTGATLEKQLNYWKTKLTGYQTLEIPTDYQRPGKIDYKGTHQEFTLSEEISQKLRSLAQSCGVTLHSVMLSSINILLGKYTGQDEILIGSPIANRNHRQTEGLIGFFVNTQANRTLLNKSQTYRELIRQVHQDQVEAQLHQDLPFEKLVNELNVERDTSRHPVFQVMFEVQSMGNQPAITTQQKNYLKYYPIAEDYEVAKFDLSIFIDDSEEELVGSLSYATSLFHKTTITRLIDHYANLLDQLIQAPDQAYAQHSILSASEYEQIIYKWNETDKDYLKDKTIDVLFEEQARKTPNNIALVFEQHQLTYKELDEQSNQLARYIRTQYKQRTNQALQANTLIALHLERSLELVIGILAVLKAGGAYVPMDPGYPQERINYLLKDTRAELILSQKHLSEANHNKLPQEKTIYIGLTEELYEVEEKSSLPKYSTVEDLAYVIYTSGTTGQPKGVMVQHKAFSQFIYNFNDYLTEKVKLTQRNVLSLTNYVFDIFGLEYALPLIAGAKITLSSLKDLKVEDLLTHQLIQQTPGTLLQVVNLYGDQLSALTCLVGGEALPSSVAEKLVAKFRKVINVYGPAETVIWSTACEINDPLKPYIGKPLFNEQVYILDSCNNPVPIGVSGELYIGGAGLALGYLNRPELTKERFVAHPFASEADKVKGYNSLYKTGDLARYLPDGNIEFIGRNDHQVKIQGYRIELGEVEHALMQLNEIQQACVLVKKRHTAAGDMNYLVAYYVMEDADANLDSIVIQERLSQVLPAYMIPAVCISMESFPVTINGKLDRRALPDPDFKSATADYMAPLTEAELKACKIWQEILGADRVGTSDDFFKTGGNSILAIQASHRMSRALNCDVKVADVFKYKTIAQLLSHSIGNIQISIPETNASEVKLSFAQERLWFIEQFEEGSNAYHIPLVYELERNTDVEGIKYALQQIVARHQVLRSTIEWNEKLGHNIQKVNEEPVSIVELNLTSKDDYKALIGADINRAFDLKKEYPIRLKLYTIQSGSSASGMLSDKKLLLINMHHIASDAWSLEVFQKELTAYYEAYLNKDTTFGLPALEIQYKDYAVWQRSYLTAETIAKQLNYWKEKLAGYQTLEIPTDYPRPATIDYKGANLEFTLTKELSQKLRTLSQEQGVTLHSVMLSSIYILLNKYTGQNDITIGGLIANRHHRQTEGLIGFFVNTLASRKLLNNFQSYEDLIQQVYQDQVEAQLYQDLPFEKLVNDLNVERDTSRHPVFQVTFEVQNIHQQAISDQQKNYLKYYPLENEYEIEKFDLSISIDDSDEELVGRISYATSLFHKTTIARLINAYTHLLEQLTRFPQQAYSEFSLLNATEYKQIITDWNATDKVYSIDKTIHQLFEEQVIRTPDNIALVYEQQQLSYKEFNAKSNQLARYIRAQYEARTNQSLKADTLIVVCLERSLEMMIGIMAVLKSGAAYVPVDPAYPQERIAYILEDTKAEVILSQKHLSEKNIGLPAEKLIHIDLAEAVYAKEDDSNLQQYSRAADLAYIIYTSGTTGRPKGAMLPHSGIVNRLEWMQAMYPLSATDVVLQKTPYVFDVSVWEILWANWYGAKIVLAKPEGHKDSAYLTQLIQREKITSLHFVPSMLEAYNHYLQAQGIQFSSTIKYLFCSGEALHQHVVQQSYELSAEASFKLHNLYGPTEASIDVTYFETSAGKNVYIGRPIQNTQVYVLDASRKPVPVGVIGELYLGGAGLARGYLNRSDLTAERFVPHPFATEADKTKGYTRLYKTGDLVRWMPDGNIEYLGRNDDQVKIRGYRIELGEIETALSQVPGIKQSCVLTKERKTQAGITKYLVAYYVLDDTAKPFDQTSILEKLSKALPEYMLPAAFVVMDAFPLTINGKLDKQALPEPDFNSLSEEYIAPITEIEKDLCEIWQEEIELDRVGISDDFFRIGGNSLLAIQVSHRMSRLLGTDVKVADVFKYKSINALLSSIRAKEVVEEKVKLVF